MPKTVNTHLQAANGVELRTFGWTKSADVSSLPATGQPGEIRDVGGKLFYWDGTRSQWVQHSTLNRVRLAATVNTSVSNPPGSVDGVATVAGDLVLLSGQTVATENGVYRVATPPTAALTRAPGFGVADLGRQVFVVSDGVSNAGVWVAGDVTYTGASSPAFTKAAARPGTVLRGNVSGPNALVDVAGREACELTLTGNVQTMTFQGWSTDTTRFQRVRVQLIQDATGGRTFNWPGVVGEWLETLPSTFPTTGGDTLVSFYASTSNGGATVFLEPIGVTYAINCPTMQVTESTVPAVAAGGTVTISHGFSMVSTVDLFETATGNHVDATTWRHTTPGVASSPVEITFANVVAAGALTVRVSGMSSSACTLSLTVDNWESATLAITSAASASVTLQHNGAASSVQWIWEPGLAPVNAAHNTAVSRVFSSTYTGNVTLRWRRGVSISTFNSGSPWSFNVAALPRTITSLGLQGTVSGTGAGLPPNLTTLSMSGSTNLSGNVSELPRTLTYMHVAGNSTMTGTVADLPPLLNDLALGGNNTLSGNIQNLSAAMRLFNVTGSNTIGGSITTGLPAGLVSIYVYGANTITGDLSGLPSTVTQVDVRGNNTISGSVASLPAGMTFFRLEGLNTTSGDISGKPAALGIYYNAGRNTVTQTAAFTPASLSQLTSIPAAPSTGMTSAMVDAILQAYDALGTTVSPFTSSVALIGTNAAPGPSGVTARTNLRARNWQINTN